MIFLQFEFYYKIIIKFFIENTNEEHQVMFKNIFERNLTKKINLEGKRNIKIGF